MQNNAGLHVLFKADITRLTAILIMEIWYAFEDASAIIHLLEKKYQFYRKVFYLQIFFYNLIFTKIYIQFLIAYIDTLLSGIKI